MMELQQINKLAASENPQKSSLLPQGHPTYPSQNTSVHILQGKKGTKAFSPCSHHTFAKLSFVNLLQHTNHRKTASFTPHSTNPFGQCSKVKQDKKDTHFSPPPMRSFIMWLLQWLTRVSD